MSVYIPGMEPPKPDEVIRIYNNGEARKCPLFEQKVIEVSVAVPVPEHGRLGDLDDFTKRMKKLVEKAENDGFDLGAAWYSAFVRHIELTPTIIPADPAKEGDG